MKKVSKLAIEFQSLSFVIRWFLSISYEKSVESEEKYYVYPHQVYRHGVPERGILKTGGGGGAP
jgi:hypothetical protein